MRTLEDYIIAIDAKNAGIVCYLRSVILSCSQHIEEKTINNTHCFFYKNFPLCDINIIDDTTELVFNYGEKLSDPFNVLTTSDHSIYKLSPFSSTKKIEPYIIITLVKQAILINELKDALFKYEVILLSK